MSSLLTSRGTATGARKAAIVMVALGEQASAELLKRLGEEEVQRLSSAIARLGPVDPEEAETVLEEFHQLNATRGNLPRGGLDYARKLLSGAFGAEAGKKHLERLQKSSSSAPAHVDVLQKADPHQLARLIQDEHPQTIALILSHLNPSQAAILLASFAPPLRAEVAVRIAKLEQISPEVVNQIAGLIGQKIREFGEVKRESYGGIRATADLFNQMDPGTSEEILGLVNEREPGLVESIRHLLFVFEDLLLLDKNGIKEVVSRVDRKLLTFALKGTSEELKAHILQTLSQRGADMLKEDMEAMGPVKIKDVQAAQQQVIAVVRQLEREGTLSTRGGGEQQYVE
ncbi:MAG: flagellar motor switch protein FliG [Candidatus Solibacter usitatus]|nr:flagellar motor switch protein FliG [Candidatus Solibacter usitatus]